jgi:hypothetical protein
LWKAASSQATDINVPAILAVSPGGYESKVMAGPTIIPNIIKWARRDEWHDELQATIDLHMGPACAKAGIEPEQIESLLDDGLIGNLWGCAFEDFLTREDPEGRNVADEYLKRRGWKESAHDRRYLAGLRRSILSLHEVSDIVPGESCLLRDLIRGGEPVRVSERSGTRYLKPWARVAARLVPDGTKTVLGGGILVFDRELADEAVKSFRRMHAEVLRRSAREENHAAAAASDDVILQSAAPLFTTIWLADVLDRVMNPRMPELRNTEGDEILFTTVRYPLAPGATIDAVRAALDGVPALDAASDHFWNWIGTVERRTPKATRKESIATLITVPGGGEDGEVVLGNVEIEAGAVVLSVNSSARADLGRKLLEPVLAGLVGSPTTATQTMEELRASSPKPAKTPSSGLSPEEERAIQRDFLDRHYAHILDEKVPVLGNRTPRQAAKTKAGRAKLVEWLKDLENTNARTEALAGYDISWIWEELGVAELRR